MPPTARTEGRGFVVACALIALASLWLRTGFPVLAIPNAGDDDALFVFHARALAAGQWLGPFSETTLVKGMFYPLFIAVSFLLGLPLKLAEQAVYLAACFVVARMLVRRPGPGWRPDWQMDWRLACVAFAVLAFNPVMWTSDLARVIREGLYIGETLALVGLGMMLGFPGDRPLARGPFLGGLMGLVGGAFWLTREEGLWILPALAVILAGSMIELFRSFPTPTDIAARLWPWAAALVVAACVVAGVAAINLARYGVFETTDVAGGAFPRAYGALARIDHDRWQRYVVLPAEARARAGAVSAAARELAGPLDGAVGAKWRRISCAAMPAEPCGEILSGWFQWALREAVAANGHYRSAPEANRYYDDLARQIDDGCARGAIPCGPRRATLAAPFRWGYLADTARTAVPVASALFSMGRGHIGVAASLGPDWAVAQFCDMVGPCERDGGKVLVVEGIVAGEAPAGLEVRARVAWPVTSTITLGPDADAPPDRPASRFTVLTDCPPAACDLVARVAGGDDLVLPLAGLAAGREAGTDRLRLTVVAAHPEDTGKAGRTRESVLVFLARPIARVYAWAVPGLAGLACLGLAAALLRRHYAPPVVLLTLVVASAAAIASRVLLLAYLDVTAIPSVNLLYATPATPFALLFAMGGVYLGAAALLAWRRRPR